MFDPETSSGAPFPVYGLKTDIQPRIEDYDLFGHLNNVRYASYLEAARLHVFSELLGGDIGRYNALTAYLEIDYRQPIPFGVPVSVLVSFSRIGTKSLNMPFQIVNRQDPQTIFALGNVSQVFMDLKARSSCPIPEDVREKMEAVMAGRSSDLGIQDQVTLAEAAMA